MRLLPLSLFGLAALASGAAVAEVYKCPAPDGAVTYQATPCAGGAKIQIQTNTVGQSAPADIKRKLGEVDARLTAKIAIDAAERDRERARYEAAVRKCRGYLDEIQRQRAWLWSISAAVAGSARAEIYIQRQKYADDRCDQLNL